jgi:protein phosphatase
MYRMRVAGLTDVGMVRTNNEDALFIDKPLLIVADGMGGAAAGEVASTIAIETISNELRHFSYSNDEVAVQQMMDSIRKADGEIKAHTKKDPKLEGMGTTIVVCLHLDSRLLIGFIGDSRAYIVSKGNDGAGKKASEIPKSNAQAQTAVLKPVSSEKKYRDGKSITRITQDHSVVMEMVLSGVILEEDIRTHPLRNRITRCLGSIGNSDPEFVWHDISEGDSLIMCSDGLWEMVHEDLILAIVNSSVSPEETCQRLIKAASNSGGVDNITVITAKFEKA